MSVLLTFPSGLAEIRRVPIDHYLSGTRRSVTLELYAEAAQDTVRLAASAVGWLDVSLNGGSSWTTLGTDVESGLDVGPLTAGERLSILVAAHHSGPFRQRRIVLLIGLGTGAEVEWEDASVWFDGELFTDPDAGVPEAIDGGTF